MPRGTNGGKRRRNSFCRGWERSRHDARRRNIGRRWHWRLRIGVLQKNLGELMQKLGDFAGAERAFREVTELLPHNATGHLQLGLLLVQVNRLEGSFGAI